MRKSTNHRWLIWLILTIVLIGVSLWHILPPYIDRWKSAQDYKQMAEDYVSDKSEPDDGKQKKKDWWLTDVKVEFDQLKEENPDIIAWIRFDNDELGIPKRYLLLFKRVSISSSDNFCLKLNTLSTAVPKSLAKGLSNEISGYVLFVSHFDTEEVVIPRAFATCSCVRPFIFLSL